MTASLFGLVIALLVGVASTAYLWLIRRRDDETAEGLLALAGMRWRDFSQLVLDAMSARGLERASAIVEEPQERSASFMLTGKGGDRWLLACKHGSAYRIGSATLEEMGSEVRLHGAQGGILVTEGTLDKSGMEKAGTLNIEVLDGRRLWPVAKPLLEDALRAPIVHSASARAKRHTGIAWLAALTLGAASAVAFMGAGGSDGASQAAARNTPVVALQPPEQAAPVPTRPPPARTEAEIDIDRDAISHALANTPGITRGVWISRSTLAVDRKVAESEAWEVVCSQVLLYPDLSLTRVQMNPPPGSDEQVRWRQCESP